MDPDDREERIRTYAINFISEATDDTQYPERLSNCGTIDENRVIKLLREAGVPMAAIVRDDLKRIFSCEEPRYFIHPFRIVELYRACHHIPFREKDEWESSPLSDAIVKLDSVFDQVDKEIEEHRAEIAAYGLSLKQYRDGVACVNEQSFFYDTQEWQDRAKVIRVMDRFTCRGCGRRDRELHVHHDEHIYSAYSWQFYRNFDSIRLRSLCGECHRAFHVSHRRGYSHFMLANPAEREEEREFRSRLTTLHDHLKECPFCFATTARAS